MIGEKQVISAFLPIRYNIIILQYAKNVKYILQDFLNKLSFYTVFTETLNAIPKKKTADIGSHRCVGSAHGYLKELKKSVAKCRVS